MQNLQLPGVRLCGMSLILSSHDYCPHGGWVAAVARTLNPCAICVEQATCKQEKHDVVMENQLMILHNFH